MAKHNPGENDLYVRTLELAQVREEDYFAHVVHKDIDGIIINDFFRQFSLEFFLQKLCSVNTYARYF